MIKRLSYFELIGLIVLSGVVIRLLASPFLKPTKAAEVPLVDELTKTKTFVFSKVNVFRSFLFIIGMSIFSFYLIFDMSNYLWVFFLLLLLFDPFMTIAELRFNDQGVIVRNLYNICVRLKYSEIKVFSKGWGNSVLTLIILKWHSLPLIFHSRGELSEYMDVILTTLEERVHKERGVVI